MAGDLRDNPVDFAQPLLDPGFLGLHVLDYNFALDELMELKIQSMGDAPAETTRLAG